jgi:hypothetical protein
MRAEHAADHAVGRAAMNGHRADQRVAPAHLDLRVFLRHAAPRCEQVILLPVLAVVLVVVLIDDFEVGAGLDPEAEALDAALDHLRPPHQNRARQIFVDDHLHRAQYALVFALRINDAAALGRFRGREEGLHDEARVVDELLQ